MGLIRELVLLPVAPLRFTIWVADQVAEEAERKQYSPGAGIEQLEEIQEARESGELEEDEAAELEGQVIEQQAGRGGPTADQEGAGSG